MMSSTTKTVLILRHAKSSWDIPSISDKDRPLNSRGQRDAPKVGQLLIKEQLVPDLILTSSAKRARQTANLVVGSSQYAHGITEVSQFYLAQPLAYMSYLSDLPDHYSRVMVIGHNPGLELLIDELTGCHENMPTAALAQVCLPIDNWPEILSLSNKNRGQLIRLWRPKETFIQ